MNNVYIIVLPALALGGFAYGVWQRQMARHDAERAFEKKQTLLQEAYSELQVDHGVDLARADGLEQELERITRDRDLRKIAVERLTKDRDMARAQRDVLNAENDKLHFQADALVEVLNERSGELEALKASVSSEYLNKLESHVAQAPVRPKRKKAGSE